MEIAKCIKRMIQTAVEVTPYRADYIVHPILAPCRTKRFHFSRPFSSNRWLTGTRREGVRIDDTYHILSAAYKERIRKLSHRENKNSIKSRIFMTCGHERGNEKNKI